MSSKTLFRLSGLALLLAVSLQIIGFVLHPPSEQVVDVLKPLYGPAHVILLLSWLLVLLGLPGLYARQAQRAGAVGLIGYVLTMLAAAYHCYLLLYEGFATPLLASQPNAESLIGPEGALGHGVQAVAAIAMPLLLAFPIFGVATLRARVYPRWAGWLQTLSLAVLFLGIFIVNPEAPAPFGTMAAAPIAWLYFTLFLGYAGCGYMLWSEAAPARERGRSMEAGRAASAAN